MSLLARSCKDFSVLQIALRTASAVETGTANTFGDQQLQVSFGRPGVTKAVQLDMNTYQGWLPCCRQTSLLTKSYLTGMATLSVVCDNISLSHSTLHPCALEFLLVKACNGKLCSCEIACAVLNEVWPAARPALTQVTKQQSSLNCFQ